MDKYDIIATFIALSILVAIFLMIVGCSYGTYNATGSYPDQQNNKNCESQRR